MPLLSHWMYGRVRMPIECELARCCKWYSIQPHEQIKKCWFFVFFSMSTMSTFHACLCKTFSCVGDTTDFIWNGS